jgi:hypothetical protein
LAADDQGLPSGEGGDNLQRGSEKKVVVEIGVFFFKDIF